MTEVIPWILLAAFLAIVSLLWRMVSAIQRTAGLTMLRQDRERLDMIHSNAILIEKLYHPDSLEIVRNHANERIHQRQLDAREREAAMPDAPAPPVSDTDFVPDNVPIEDSVHT